jgi:hypothetical protein
MTLEDELAELRGHVRDLQALVVAIIPDDRVTRLDELNLLRLTIAERAGTHAFELGRRYLDGGRYGFVVTPAYKRTTVDPAVVAYVERLRRLGMEIEVEATPGTAP